MGTEHPDPPDTIPEDVVEAVREMDIRALDDLRVHLEREMTVRSSKILETQPSELPAKYLRD